VGIWLFGTVSCGLRNVQLARSAKLGKDNRLRLGCKCEGAGAAGQEFRAGQGDGGAICQEAMAGLPFASGRRDPLRLRLRMTHLGPAEEVDLPTRRRWPGAELGSQEQRSDKQQAEG
jgi:hypothetical protein